MTSTQETLTIILAVELAVFFLLLIITAIMGLQAVGAVKRVVAKAENVVDSVESAAEVLRDAQGKMAFFKLLNNIFKMTGKGK
jgi:hypothetical protein